MACRLGYKSKSKMEVIFSDLVLDTTTSRKQLAGVSAFVQHLACNLTFSYVCYCSSLMWIMLWKQQRQHSRGGLSGDRWMP